MMTEGDGFVQEDADGAPTRAAAKQRGRRLKEAGEAGAAAAAGSSRTTGARFLVSAADAAGSLQSGNSYFEGRFLCVFENTFKLKEDVCISMEKRNYTRDDVSKCSATFTPMSEILFIVFDFRL
jgi:hypothetical protein